MPVMVMSGQGTHSFQPTYSDIKMSGMVSQHSSSTGMSGSTGSNVQSSFQF